MTQQAEVPFAGQEPRSNGTCARPLEGWVCSMFERISESGMVVRWSSLQGYLGI